MYLSFNIPVLKTLINKKLLLILIFCLGLFLRLFQLSEFPVGLHGDEASVGYNAYSLLKTARDQNGNFLPLSINQFGDFRPAGYHYLDIPFVAIFGLNPFAVRLPVALFGSFTVLLLYLLLNELFQNTIVALLGAFLLAILPWDINISRASSEAIIASFFSILGIYFSIRGVKSKSYIFPLFAISAVSFVISFFFYHAPRYIMPLLFPIIMVCAFLTYRPSRKKMLSLSLVYIAILIAFTFFFTIGKGTGRVSEVSILNIPGGTTQLKTAMDEEGTLNPLLTRFYDNKFYFFGRFFLTFYSEHFTGDYLFVNTGFPIRYLIPFTGNLYLIEAPFLLFGFVFLLYEGLKKKRHMYLVPIFWLFIAPIPAGLTYEDLPNVERSSFMIYALMMIAAFGFHQTIIHTKHHWRYLLIILSTLILLQNFLYFYHNYFWRLKIQNPWYRSASEPDLIYAIDRFSPQYSQVDMTTEHNNNFIFYLFYNKFDPKKFQQLGSPEEHEGLRFGKIVYTYNPCPLVGATDKYIKPQKNILYVDKETCSLPKNAEVIDTIRTPDGIPSFLIVALNPVPSNIPASDIQ